jgi:hypothetical protein
MTSRVLLLVVTSVMWYGRVGRDGKTDEPEGER